MNIQVMSYAPCPVPCFERVLFRCLESIKRRKNIDIDNQMEKRKNNGWDFSSKQRRRNSAYLVHLAPRDSRER